MKTLIFVSVLLVGAAMQASDLKSYQSGVLKEMTSVECGYEQKSGNTFVGEVLGTDGAHSKTHKTLCHEYVLQTNHIVITSVRAMRNILLFCRWERLHISG
jgi:hypothetical protein